MIIPFVEFYLMQLCDIILKFYFFIRKIYFRLFQTASLLLLSAKGLTLVLTIHLRALIGQNLSFSKIGVELIIVNFVGSFIKPRLRIT